MYCASLGTAVTKTFIYFQSLKVQLWHRNLLDSLQLAIQMIKHLSNHFPSTHILISNINSMLLSNCRMKDNTETAVTLSSLRKQNSKILMLQVNAKRLNTWKKKKSKQNKKCQIIQSRALKSRQNQRHTITTVSNVEELIFAETLHCDTGTLSITNKQPKAGPVHDALQISPKPWQQALRTIIFSVSCCFPDSFIAPVIESCGRALRLCVSCNCTVFTQELITTFHSA